MISFCAAGGPGRTADTYPCPASQHDTARVTNRIHVVRRQNAISDAVMTIDPETTALTA
jgi:hypothetical protein